MSDYAAGIRMIRTHYLDASALVKLIADDVDEQPGREALTAYYWANTANVYSTSYSITEALSAFKSKYGRGRINQDTYKKIRAHIPQPHYRHESPD